MPNLRRGFDWKATIAFALAAASTAYGVAKWAATSPTRDEFEHVRNDVVQIRLDQAVSKNACERTASDVAEIKTNLGELRRSLEEPRHRGR